MSENFLVCALELESFCERVLQKAGLSGAYAKLVADSLLFADLRGVASHGTARLKTYLERVTSGVMELNPQMTIEQESVSAALFDARNGFGQIAGTLAMQKAIEKAKVTGIAAVAVKNSNHFGVAAYYAMQAVRENMIGLVITNASPAMPVFNTLEPLLGTNPIAIAVPAGEEFPIVLDMSTSVVARGKIRRAALTGVQIPLGWARDASGNPTDDPNAALNGFIEPLGGPKGSGLSLMFDILCGILSGSSMTGEIKNIMDMTGPSRTGHFFIAINTEKWINPVLFRSNIDRVIRKIKATPTIDGGAVYLPGEIELRMAAKRKAEGILLSVDVIEELRALARKFSVDMVETLLSADDEDKTGRKRGLKRVKCRLSDIQEGKPSGKRSSGIV